jgi:stringent starvation protein B
MSANAPPATASTRPYLIRALHEWCSDNGFTPYLAVSVDATVRVPMEYVRNDEIVLNVGLDATSGLTLGNEWIEFKARFGGVARDILVPVERVLAIYARENGQGMAFPVPSPQPKPAAADAETPSSSPSRAGGDSKSPRGGAKPSAEASAPVLRLAPVKPAGKTPAKTSTKGSVKASGRAADKDSNGTAEKALAKASGRARAGRRKSDAGTAQAPAAVDSAAAVESLPSDVPPPPSKPPAGGRPALKRVK